jgi:uncharacterized membrane protein YfcA
LHFLQSFTFCNPAISAILQFLRYNILLTPILALVLFSAALSGGALNAIAGGGSFIALPALLYAGVPPVEANATNTFALWPASISSAWAYRREVAAARTWLAGLGLVSVAGGLVGAQLLVRTSDAGFLRFLPWLMLVAAVTFTIGDRFSVRSERRAQAWSPLALLLQLLIATYGGYFGGGMGIMTLATLSIAGMADIHQMNGVKLVMAVLINGASLVEFVAGGVVVWQPGLVMVAGGIVGGYAAAAAARRFDERRVRQFIIGISWVLTVYFFLR